MNFGEFRTWFDERFSLLLHQKTADFASLSESVDAASIVSYIKTIAQEGKRFRPFLLYSASGLQEECDKHFALFASVELLHLFALIHDDIMDKADTRHNVMCAHKKFVAQYGEVTGEAIGILLGDIVFAWAYECLFAYTKMFPHSQDRIVAEFVRLVSEVTHGQLLDILSPQQSPLDEKAIIEKMTLKTARYSFVQPLRLGFIIRGDSATDQLFAENFGLSLGIGFQLQDDLLDSVPSIQTGKTQCVDMQSGQQTFLSWYMQHQATDKDQKEFVTLFGKQDMSESERQALLALLESSGAIAYVKTKSVHYFADAADAIYTYRTNDSAQWKSILALVQERKK